jgi:hypothetical protein
MILNCLVIFSSNCCDLHLKKPGFVASLTEKPGFSPVEPQAKKSRFHRDLLRFPLTQYQDNVTFYFGACLSPFIALRQECVVRGLCVPNMSDDGQSNCILIEAFGGRRSADAPAVLEAGVLGDGLFSSGRASRVELAHTRRKTLHVLAVKFCPSGRCTLSAPCPGLLVG